MSDEEDDYMSNDFLAQVEHVKPGVSKTRHSRRMLKIHANQEEAAERQRAEKPKSKAELERTRLEEGIQKPICNESKGFKLLAMMGYKPGMSLGKAREGQIGIKEPIPIQMKADRTGVGHETEVQEKQKERCEAHMEHMRKRARMEEVLADDFRDRKRFVAIQKQIVADIQRIRRACQEMDIRSGKEEPDEFWFWPIYSSKSQEDGEEEKPTTSKRRKFGHPQLEEEDESEVRNTYSNGRLAPVDVNFYELDECALNNSLHQIVAYMRAAHHYCIWCGCSFEDDADLAQHCPGMTRNDHEE